MTKNPKWCVYCCKGTPSISQEMWVGDDPCPCCKTLEEAMWLIPETVDFCFEDFFELQTKLEEHARTLGMNTDQFVDMMASFVGCLIGPARGFEEAPSAMVN